MRDKYQAISAFDLDHTLLTVSSSYSFGSYLFRKKFFPFSKMISLVYFYASHKTCGMSISALHQKIFDRLFRNNPMDGFEKHLNFFISEMLEKNRYFPALNKLEAAKKLGHYTLLLSSSPQFLVGPIADALEIDEWHSSHYAVDSQNRLSHISRIVQAEEKSHYLQEVAKRLKIPLQKTTAYSDSFLDLSFLQSAGKAVAVNPDHKLKKAALKYNWEII